MVRERIISSAMYIYFSLCYFFFFFGDEIRCRKGLVWMMDLLG